MMMNPGIILAGQQPDVMGQFARGLQAGGMHNDIRQQNAMRAMMQQHGPGIMAGEQGSLNEFARFDPRAALGVQETRQGMAHADERLEMARQQARQSAASHVAQMDDRERAREREMIDRGLGAVTAAQSPEQWDHLAEQFGMPQFVGQFENRQSIIGHALGLRDALAMNQPPQEPTAVMALRIRAQEAGLQPGTPEYQQFMQSGGGQPSTVVNVGGRTGTIPPGFALIGQGEDLRMMPIPGGPAAQDASRAADQADMRAGQTARYGRVVIEDIGRVRDAIGGSRLPVTGPVGGLLSLVPGTNAYDVSQLLETIRANIGFDRLQAMREASPTGGALGAVSDFENRQLQATLGNLGQSQSQEQFLRNLERLNDLYTQIIHGPPPSGIAPSEWSRRAWSGDEGQSAETFDFANPQPGDVVEGYRFNGGDPADPASWERVR